MTMSNLRSRSILQMMLEFGPKIVRILTHWSDFGPNSNSFGHLTFISDELKMNSEWVSASGRVEIRSSSYFPHNFIFLI